MKQAISVAALIDLFPDPDVRKQVRCAALKLGPEVMARPAQDIADALEEKLRRYDSPEFAKSASAYKYYPLY